MKWYLKVLKQYATFSGRARRKEFWMFTLFDTIFIIVLRILDELLGTTTPNGYYDGIFSAAYALFTLIPTWAVTFRRLHDIGLSGWWYGSWQIVLLLFIFIGETISDTDIIDEPIAIAIGTIFFIGGVVLLIQMVTPGNPNKNRYGDNPIAKPTPLPSTEKKLGDESAQQWLQENKKLLTDI